MIKKEENIDIYIFGNVANEAIKFLIEKKKNDLLKYFSTDFIEEAYEDIIKTNDIMSNIKLKTDFNIETDDIFIYEATKGGIFTALWESLQLTYKNHGLEFSQREIPIKQYSIEIAEYFGLNVYRMFCKNVYVIFVNRKIDLIKLLKVDNEILQKIPLVKIGRVNFSNKKKVRIDAETESFLTKDYKDEVFKIIDKKDV